MSSVMPFTVNAVEWYVVTINEKPWTRAREVCRALEYSKATNAADIVKHLCSRENYTHKWQLKELVSETKFMDWPMHSRKDEYYTNKKEWLRCYFQVNSLRQDTSEDTAAMCCFVMFDSSLQKNEGRASASHQRKREQDPGHKIWERDIASKKRFVSGVATKTVRHLHPSLEPLCRSCDRSRQRQHCHCRETYRACQR